MSSHWAHQLPRTGSCLIKCPPTPEMLTKQWRAGCTVGFPRCFPPFRCQASAALFPHRCQPGRRTEQPLGFSFLFLRPVNFHKAFNVRTSRLISRVAYSEPSTTAVIWLLRQGPRPQQPETLPDPSLNSPRCDLAEQIVWTLDGLCHNEMVSFLPER